MCFPRSADEVAAAVRDRARATAGPFVARGSGTGLAGGATPLDDPRRDRHHADEPRARGRPGRAGRLGRARRAQPRPQPRGRATSACTTRPIRRRSRPARSAATSPPTPAARTAWPSGVTSAHVLAVDVVLADGSVARLGGLEPDTPGYDLRGLLRRLRGHDGHRHPDRGAPHARTRRRRARCCSTSRRSTTPPPTVSGDHRGRHRARRARDDGRRDHPGGRGLRRRRLPARRRGGAARRGRRPRRRRRRTQVDAVDADRAASTARARVRVAADDAERALLWKGRKSAFGAIARIAPDYYLHDAVVPAHEARRGAAPGLRDRATRSGSSMMNVFHAGDGNLHPLIVFDAPRTGRVGARARRRRRDPRGVHRRGRRARPASTASGSRSASLMPLHVHAPTTSTPRRGCATRSIPTARANPQKVLPRGQPVRRAAARPGGRVDLTVAVTAVDELARRSRRGRRSSPVGARTHWEVGGPPPTGDVEVARAGRRRRVRARRPDRDRRRGHDVRRARRRAAPSTGRSARSIHAIRDATVGGVARVRAVGHPPAAATDRCATTCSRCASSPPTAGS